MSQDNRHTGAGDANDEAAAHAHNTSLGVSIGIGAGLGLVAGLLFGDMVLGMLYGAGFGTVVDAVRELVQSRSISAPKPTRVGGPARPVSLRWLLGCLAFLGVSAAFGGVVLTLNPTGTWLQIPLSILQFSPFRDFLIPGLILGIVFGIGSFATLLALWFRMRQQRDEPMLRAGEPIARSLN